VLRILIFGIVVVFAIATYLASYSYFRSEELVSARARLSLYQSTVVAELERFSHLTFVLARDPLVVETAGTGLKIDALNERLAAFADRAGIDAIYLMDASGVTRAASNAGTPNSFVGQDYSFRPYFRDALNGEQGEFYGIGATTGIPGYFFADAVEDTSGAVLGVVAIKIDLFALQENWRLGGEQVILANGDGISLLSSEPDWRYRALSDLTAEQRSRIEADRQFTGQPLDRLEWALTGDDAATIGGRSLLYIVTDDLPNGWSLHYFAPDDRAVTRAWLATGLIVLLAGLGFIAYQIQRARRISAALKRSEDEEAQLRIANERLAVEIDERINAERRLQRTQSELERAGRLAALGQLSASVTHELGQPIAAMRNHLAAAEMQSGALPLTERLTGLVDRMEGITRQLKFFARKGRDSFEDLDLRDVMAAALELLDPTLTEDGVTVHTLLPEHPVVMHGNRLRLEQVVTNLLRNAVDALDAVTEPQIEIRLGQSDKTTWFEVADNGHGLGDRSMADLREPFATTRESGKGMGLGLTISAGIVDDHGGTMTARNRADAGAVFRASFPRAEEALVA